ncbi:Lrp/AsnC family transcriptional regulator [Gulosibacter molinativorax]|nr:winged helix-turn-helix transcriptional regulator [Gulosibacter molinativorax]QUY63092.1 Hypotetical protein [Gulosibacter molinativorax]
MAVSRIELEGRLFAALKREPRASVLALAESTGFPRAVIANHLKDLQRSGCLRVIGALHPKLTGTPTLAAIGIAVAGPIAPVLEFIAPIEEVVSISTITGLFPIGVEVRVTTPDHLQAVLDRLRAHPSVVKIETRMFGRVIKGHSSHSVPDEIVLDEKDSGLIEALGEDGRTSWQELAERVSLTPAAARTRVRRLIDANVLRIVVLERGDLHSRGIALVANLALRGDSEAILGQIAEELEVEFAATEFGKGDGILVIRSRSQESLFALLERIRAIPGVMEVETRTYLHHHKETSTGIPLTV